MRKIYLLIMGVLVYCTPLFSQNVNVNPGAGSYPTLKDAFDAINLGTHTGVITVDIVGNTTETLSAVLNASGVGGASYTSIVISPSGGVSRTISGNIAGHMVDLNGADNVTIDGLNSGGNVLFIINNDGGGLSSTIRFTNDASNNTIVRTNINGSAGNIVSGFGVIYFGTGTTTGNDNNLIDQCNISSAGGGTPLNAIYSFGTSTAIDNSVNTISANNISNFFSAGNPSNGMNINTGNSGWTINSNSFYQTATRTGTTANTHNGIFITSGNGYTITNNFIGGTAPSNGGTAWTFNGTIANRFVGINISSTVGTSSSIQNNTISNFALATSSGATTGNGIWCGISANGAGTFNIGTTTGNTIGATSGVGSVVATSTTAGGLLVGINSTCTGTITIQNNSFGALTCSGITAAVSGSITLINFPSIATSTTISSNTLGNTTVDNVRGGTSGLTTGSSLVSGINVTTGIAGASTFSVTNNTIQNLSSYGTNTAGFVRGFMSAGFTGVGTVFTITNNNINNLKTNATLTTVANGQACVTGIQLGQGLNSLISQNTIHTLSNINTTATGNFVAGIGYGAATSTIINRNRIYNLANAGTSVTVTTPSIAVGIIVRSGTTAVSIYNNMISLGNAQTTNTAFLGIQCNNGSVPDPINNIYYNSINIEGTAAAGAQPSFGIARTDFSTTARTVTMNIKNNIVTNTRSGGTGLHYAIANNYGAAAASSTGWSAGNSNNNVLNATAANVGWWTAATTFAGWKTASASDALSVSGVTVTYTNTVTADLHLNLGITPTQIESGGVAIAGITTDYDNDLRPGPTGSVNGGAIAPDMGADEFDGVPLDLFAPTISYSLLLNNNCTTTRTFTATASDNSGVNVTVGTKPRVYYKKSTDANNYVGNTSADNGWKYVEASNAASPFSFTIDYSIVNGGTVSVGDIIQYFVVAQDLSPAINVAINSGTFTLTPASVALTAAAFPIGGVINSYSIIAGLSTSLTVGAAGNYTSITGAGGLFSAINANGLIGNTTVNILDASVTETGAVALNPIQPGDCSATAYTLTIKPNTGVTSTLTGSIAGYLIRILSSGVKIDGSNNGTSSRDLTITNTSVTSPSVILIGSTGTTPITDDVIKNTIIINGATTNTAVVVSDAAAPGSTGYFNNITIDNNSIQRAFIGVFCTAVATGTNGSGLLLTNNSLNTLGANALRRVGLYLQGVNGATVSNNNIGNFENVNAENDMGIWLATDTKNVTVSNNTITTLGCTTASTTAPTGINITSNTSATGNVITGNSISNISSAGGTTGTSANGIFMGFATSGVTISKNNITNIKNTSASGWGANGILLTSTLTAANCNVNNNFISDVAAFGFASSGVDDNGYGIGIGGGGGYNIDYNSINMNTNQTTAGAFPACINITSAVTTATSVNIRNNIFNHSATGGSTQRYAILSTAANTVFGTIDYNDYYTTAANLGNIAATDRPTIATIQAGFGGNANSLNVLPNFTSATDLHLVATNNCGLDGRGTPVTGITTDIDNQTRDVVTPDMGADEFTSTYTTTLAGVVSTTVCESKTVTPTGTSFTTNNCDLIARVVPSGASPVTGVVNSCVYTETAPPLPIYNAEPYLHRHFDITPVTNPLTSTATITLYFTQAEFDTYNVNNGAWPDLPSAPGDAAGIANLKITQYHGSATPPGGWPANPSLPNQYSAGTGTYIDPVDANIVWNGSYWAVTFDVTGFSGFYIHTNLRFALPISFNYLNGTKQGGNHLLNWKVTCNTSPKVTMVLERSASTTGSFTAINTVDATAARCAQPFNYTDANPLQGMNYYRLKMIDADNRVTYSNVIAILNATKGFDVLNIAPNPVTANGNFKLNVTSAKAEKLQTVITDMQGRIVLTETINMTAGYNSIDMNVGKLAAGTYTIYGINADGEKSKVMRFVKQ